MAAAGDADQRRLDIDGALPARHSRRRMARLAAAGRLDQRQIYRACYGLLVVTALKLLWDGVHGYLG